MKRIVTALIFMAAFCFTGNVALQAATIKGNAPYLFVYTINGNPVNTEVDLGTTFQDAIDDANAEISKYKDQKDLATGFANANAYAANSAPLWGYEDYKIFAIMTGFMLGVQAPSVDPSYYSGIGDKIKDEGDLYAGIGAGFSYFNVGINTSFLLDGLYMNIKFGYMPESFVGNFTDQVRVKSTMFGVGANYMLLRSKSFTGAFLWRGISVGSGLLYQGTTVKTNIDIDDQTQPYTDDVAGYNFSADVVVDPTFQIGLDVKTVTIPFEANTSVQLLWFLNLSAGVGVDLVFGRSDIILDAAGDSTVDNISSTDGEVVYDSNPGNLSVSGSTKKIPPSWIRTRIMAGLGLNIWKIKIDIPFVYYPKSGAAVGVSAGFVW